MDRLLEIRDQFWDFPLKAVEEDESWKSQIVKEDILSFTLEKSIRIQGFHLGFHFNKIHDFAGNEPSTVANQIW